MPRRTRKTETEEDARNRPAPEERDPEARATVWTAMARWGSTMTGLVVASIFVVEALLATRLGFRLAGASPNNDFVDFIYDLTNALVAPFRGIRETEQIEGGVFEPETAVAMGLYLLAAIALVLAVRAITLGPIAGRERAARRRADERPLR